MDQYFYLPNSRDGKIYQVSLTEDDNLITGQNVTQFEYSGDYPSEVITDQDHQNQSLSIPDMMFDIGDFFEQIIDVDSEVNNVHSHETSTSGLQENIFGMRTSRYNQTEEAVGTGSPLRNKECSESSSDDGIISNSVRRKKKLCSGIFAMLDVITIMKDRTGAVGRFEVTFENNKFNSENAEVVLCELFDDNIISSCRKSKRARIALNSDENSVVELPRKDSRTGGNPELKEDHPYAATILTQSESSCAVRDHQYNQPDTSQHSFTTTTKSKGSYVKLKHARESVLNSLMTKLRNQKSELQIRTAAEVKWSVQYEGLKFDEDNFKESMEKLKKTRNFVQVYPTEKSTVVSTTGQKEVHITFKLPTKNVTEHHHRVRRLEYSSVTIVNDSTRTTNSIANDHSSYCVPSSSFPISANEKESTHSKTTTIGTNTEPICSKCFSPFSPDQSVDPFKDPFWIRCSNPLCFYLVHATCMGFVISSSSYLRLLPPFFCEAHRQLDY